MSDTDAAAEEPPKKKSKKPLIVGIALAVLCGGGGFYAVSSGMLLGGGHHDAAESDAHDAEPLPDVAFVPIEPLVVNLGKGGTSRHLKFRAQLEVEPPHAAEIETMLPRVLDVLNGYLRAVSIADLEEPAALIRLRAQMLRRVQMVLGDGKVRDLLIMEFVLN